MKSKIRVLSEQTINQIAAGEVIENPASVVKEIVENAIDAESTEITIEIIAGGRNLIRVTDNGFGMSKDDALLCLERHATSKIKDVDDIQSIMTMGFRGEAIPSIASISKFSLLTSAKDEQKATLIIVDGGKILDCQEAVRSVGTTIEIKSLFFNVPVRKKFQKSPTYDANEILKIVTHLSLAHPKLKIELISNEKKVLSSPSLKEEKMIECLKSRIETHLGEDFKESLYPVEGELKGFKIFGFIGYPSITRQNRTGQYLYINQRSVQNPLVSYSVREGYGTSIPNNRHPVYVLHLIVPNETVDVNVHPQKREVRLRQELILKELIVNSVRNALQHSGYSSSLSTHETLESFTYQNFEKTELFSPFQQKFSFIKQEENHVTKEDQTVIQDYLSKKDFEFIKNEPKEFEPSLFSSQELFKEPTILNTIPNYIFIDPNSLDDRFKKQLSEKPLLCIVDQKAAHSRIIFDQFDKNRTFPVEQLLIPYTFQTTPVEESQILSELDFLNQSGIQIHQTAPKQFQVEAIPSFIQENEFENFLKDFLESLSEPLKNDFVHRERENQLAFLATRAAISQNKTLSHMEAKSLLNQLLKCETVHQDPRGKPIFAFVNKDTIKKLFN